MNHIDAMLLKHANKIEILVYPHDVFIVNFASFPSDEVLAPVIALIESKRFEFSHSTLIRLFNSRINELLEFRICSINVIPISDAIRALFLTWRDMGYQVTVKPANGYAISQKDLAEICS
ncbi:MAG: hypothetical protein ACRC4U_11790 [Shewanella sp.]